MIDSDQRAFYEEKGYLLLDNFVSDEWLNRLRAASDIFVEQSRELSKSNKVLDLEPDHASASPRLRRLVSPVDHHEAFHEFAMSGPAAEIALAILGDPVRFHHSKLNYKWSNGGEEVKWHQDIQFWPHTDFTPLTIGIYLDTVDDAMGPMGVLPGSHKGEIYDQYDDDDRWAGAMKACDIAKLDLDEVAWLKGSAGAVTVHNCCMVHGSVVNQSPRPRRLLLQTYSAGASYPVSGIGANNLLGKHGGRIIGKAPSQRLNVDGRILRGAPDWGVRGVPTIFGSQQGGESDS